MVQNDAPRTDCMPIQFDNYAAAAQSIVERVGKKIVIGAPLGIGKPIGLLNALYRLAESDPSIDLTILTALTLARPNYGSDLEKRFVSPLLERLLTNYEDPLYEQARVAQRLPKNINVIEFFLMTAKYLHNDYVQQNYINSTYSLAARDALDQGVNVMAQQVARSSAVPYQYSVSSNSDLFDAVVNGLRVKEANGEKIAILAEVNQNMPFMYGNEAVFNADVFTAIIDAQDYKSLFAIPHDELSAADHLIGFYTSFLVKDDSCLQIGIGKLSNSLANALIVRDQDPVVYQSVFEQLQAAEKFGEIIKTTGGLTPFTKGLYASTEMFSDSYMELLKIGILKKRVYDHIALQRLLNEKKLAETLLPDTLDVLLTNKLIQTNLTADDVAFLQEFGIFHQQVKFDDGMLVLPDNLVLSGNLTNAAERAAATKHCLGKSLSGGKIIHAGFFLGTNALYQYLRDLPETLRLQIDMTSIARTNSLNWSYELLALQRVDARFVNTAMMVTLGAVVISDGLQDMREVSGVGGQFDFVNMAQSLPTARSIINCHSTRATKQGVTSNIIWEYASFTIPRFLRDIVVTEYGIADCRAKTDSQIIKNMLNITDSRFQPGLLAQAKAAGKIEKDYQIPALFQQNHTQRIKALIKSLQQQGLCEPFPFGTELTVVELALKKVLLTLQGAPSARMLMWAIGAIFFVKNDEVYRTYLQRMDLLKPATLKQWFYKKLVKFMLHKTLPVSA
jgi:acyl-CoA hydrolase